MAAPLGDIYIRHPEDIINCNNCLVTVATPNFIDHLEVFLKSFYLNSNSENCQIIIFCFGDKKQFESIYEKYKVQLIFCEDYDKRTFKNKTAALMCADVVNAQKYLYIDADCLILQPIDELFKLMDSFDDDKLFIVKEGKDNNQTLYNALKTTYYSNDEEIEKMQLSQGVLNGKSFNNGIYGGKKKAIFLIKNAISDLLPNMFKWEKEKIYDNCLWREQAVFNIAINKLNNYIELSNLYNFQLHYLDCDFDSSKMLAKYKNNPIKILHFNGSGRNKLKELFDFYYMRSFEINKTILIKKYINNNISENNQEQQLNIANFLIKFLFNNQNIQNVLLFDNNIQFLPILLSLYKNINVISEVGDKITLINQKKELIDTIIINDNPSDYELYAIYNLINKQLNKNLLIINNNDIVFNKFMKKIHNISLYHKDQTKICYLNNQLST